MGREHTDARGHASAERPEPARQPALIGRALLTVALVGLALVAAPSAVASPASHASSRLEQRAAREYWTPQRMRDARELRVDRAATRGELRRAGLGSFADSAVTGPVDPADYANFNPATSRPPHPPTAAATRGRYVAPPFVSGAVDPAAIPTYPYSANGKLFGVYRGIGSYSCSATVVSSSSHNVVLTAGHCLRDQNAGFARNVIFVPAYDNGSRPFGGWSASYITVPRGWARGDYHRDYGAAKLTAAGNPVGTVVGEEGLAWNQPREQLYQPIGYPFNLGGTELMWNCFSGSGGVDPIDVSRGALDTGVGCDMGSGASGGGWTIRDSFGNAFLNGVTSYGYKKLANVLFAAYFNGKVLRTVNNADRN